MFDWLWVYVVRVCVRACVEGERCSRCQGDGPAWTSWWRPARAGRQGRRLGGAAWRRTAAADARACRAAPAAVPSARSSRQPRLSSAVRSRSCAQTRECAELQAQKCAQYTGRTVMRFAHQQLDKVTKKIHNEHLNHVIL